jgi:hypothetical protein
LLSGSLPWTFQNLKAQCIIDCCERINLQWVIVFISWINMILTSNFYILSFGSLTDFDIFFIGQAERCRSHHQSPFFQNLDSERSEQFLSLFLWLCLHVQIFDHNQSHTFSPNFCYLLRSSTRLIYRPIYL